MAKDRLDVQLNDIKDSIQTLINLAKANYKKKVEVRVKKLSVGNVFSKGGSQEQIEYAEALTSEEIRNQLKAQIIKLLNRLS